MASTTAAGLQPCNSTTTFWLTLSGLAGTESVHGHYASSPTRQMLLGPFRTLAISTTHAGTVHIPALSWQPVVRH
ncbi:hypothetical protein M2396_001987 [Pseudomonas sp. BIGb0278]|uniref:hypothetical protein n=1 Tax=Pseudomonas sp. BIGb0278 TaxID=2940607 RepID=UPI002169752E|nr:hypothetical protein [Pseudomonas sp. BIGb0278]MCS4283694.1 hypothetical protein [Pseudomonas sp. BIGb0278]